MGVQGSHPSAFKGYRFGVCPQCEHRGLYQGRTRNPKEPVLFVRCRHCGFEQFGAGAFDPNLRSI